MIVGLFARPPLAEAAVDMDPGAVRAVLFLIDTDGLALLFMAGVVFALLGWLRNRKSQTPPLKGSA